MNHHAILRELVKKHAKSGAQQTLEDAFQKAAVKEFSRDEVLKAVTKFVICDNQVNEAASCMSWADTNFPEPCRCGQSHVSKLPHVHVPKL